MESRACRYSNSPKIPVGRSTRKYPFSIDGRISLQIALILLFAVFLSHAHPYFPPMEIPIRTDRASPGRPPSFSDEVPFDFSRNTINCIPSLLNRLPFLKTS